MIETHSIRLRGPWECESLGGHSRRIHMPAPRREVIDDADRGRLLCRRRFGCPTCLDPHERVFLVMELPAFSGNAQLNDEPLGPIDAADRAINRVTEFDITGRLRERNELLLDFDLTSIYEPAGDFLFADVRLEIRG